MKTLLLLLCLTFVIPSCTTFKQVFSPERSVLMVNIAVPPAVRLGLAKEPKARPYLVALADAIELFATGTSLTPEALQNVMNTTGVEEFKTPQALVVSDMLMTFYRTFYADAVNAVLDEKKLLPVLEAFVKGIRDGL